MGRMPQLNTLQLIKAWLMKRCHHPSLRLAEANRGITTACTRPRIRLNVIENLSVVQLDARRVMPGVRQFSEGCTKDMNIH